MNRHLDGGQELIVVDNDSADDPEAAARRWRGPGWYLEMDDNHGFGAAVNAGVAQASNDTVVVLNPDTELVDDSLAQLASTATRLAALVGPRVLNRDGSTQPSASGPAVGVWPWVRAFLPSGILPARILAKTAPWRLDSLTPVTWLTGACFAGPRDVLRDLGPFDATIDLYGEDLDLGVRAGKAGVASFIAPQACSLIHDGKVSTSGRYEDLGRAQAGVHGRAVLLRAYGRRRERAAWWAERANLRLRVLFKRLLRRDPSWDELVLGGLEKARSFAPLPAWASHLPEPPEPVIRRAIERANPRSPTD